MKAPCFSTFFKDAPVVIACIETKRTSAVTEFLKEKGLKIRPTAYTPFYEMNHNLTAEQISKYDKRTYYAGIENLSYADFLRLVYDTDNYQKVLRMD